MISSEVVNLIRETSLGKLFIKPSVYTRFSLNFYVMSSSLPGVQELSRVSVQKRPKKGMMKVIVFLWYPDVQRVKGHVYEKQIDFPIQDLTPEMVISEMEEIHNNYMENVKVTNVQSFIA